MTNLSQDLTRGSIRAHLVRMTIPMFLGISSMIVASMMDTVYIGLLGANELAAISFTFPLIMALTSVSMGIGNGAASVIARAQGAGDRERVRRLSTHATLLTIMLVIVLMIVGLVWQDRLFDLMGAQPGILPLVVEYMDVWILGLVFFTLPMVGSTILRSVGNARLPGYIMTTSSLIQIVLAPLLIFGLLGFPELGFVGSAWAFIICGIWRTVGMLWISIFQERLLLFGSGALSGMWSSTRTILYIGFPSMLNAMIGPVSMGTIIWLLAQHGPEVVAGFGIASRIEMLVMMVLMSLSSSIGPFVGQNWGARKFERVYEALR
ncbi:MAG: MATE family efflux transporter, partial [Pseudomonadales bacterium]|nr:MATE family efflux transporter [Pseudomonadales bacterium]